MQTSYPTEERLGRAGAAYDSRPDSISRIAEAPMRPGDVALRGDDANSNGKTAQPLAAPVAADADGVMTTRALLATAESLSGAALDGAIGGDRMVPGRNVTLALNNDLHWTAGTITVHGEDDYGRAQSEAFTAPSGGNVTLTGTKTFSKVTQVDTPAGGGANRTLAAGIGSLLGSLTSRDVLGLVRYLAALEVAPGDTHEFAQYDVLNIIHGGRVWVEVEEDVLDGEQLYVRLVAAGAEVVGGFRNDRDGTASAPDAVPVIGMRFWGDSVTRNGTRLAVVEVSLPNI